MNLKANADESVYVIPIEETVEKGLSEFIKRGFNEAKQANADHIILDINTPGGAVDAALKISDTINDSDIPVTAFVNRRALSAGAYLALNADQIYMTEGAKMGAAAIIDLEGNAADKKSESLWLAEMKDAAEKNNRDPKYALAMADVDVDAADVGAPKGELLTLTTSQALDVGYAEGEAEDLNSLLQHLNLANAEVHSVDLSLAEKVARFVTHPVVVPILLSIGSLGLIVELYSPGFGIPGAMGLTSLFLFFYGHLVAGLAGMETIILFVIGLILVIAELFVPGGILGIIGFIAIIVSLFLASGSIIGMAISLLIAAAVSITASILLTKVLGKRMNIFKRLILRDSTNTESGYISNKTRSELLGKTGVALTSMRPSGTALVEDERLDVVTEGTYIAKGEHVKIVKVDGSRIVVREIINQKSTEEEK
ncbi:nodulation protein NfeD [Bacillus sp. IB182487]|uniref:Nodulation protein NfeD n=1 Tax=Metabacillus arenae TaxID=2771434 RepID=A0A926RYT2_9BACI|nr:nodulation protein NfeD [Metabacillus arenae]MBD1382100.1 nodulation protein NfeD [Metabacillus arenae]